MKLQVKKNFFGLVRLAPTVYGKGLWLIEKEFFETKNQVRRGLASPSYEQAYPPLEYIADLCSSEPDVGGPPRPNQGASGRSASGHRVSDQRYAHAVHYTRELPHFSRHPCEL